ncbi:heat shock protein Hsp70 [Chloropicon primus]|uniref:Heat shock protein Hsp70 n=1 Tax=Chloropicon primus TaxID=1764295 RepID=A0A5B8MNL6_9CHLO|nr:heat shock protein Hsp70 [Chloropicon primus]UPR01217.1 heat shock protein Hsp70 [Chloropicon primus]|eukprot:QDZ21997.1 heat shock protein Hsp70 [Chloropicon primus]
MTVVRGCRRRLQACGGGRGGWRAGGGGASRRRGDWSVRRAIGIDLGTTNSAVAVTKDGETFVVPGPDKTKVTRSVVSYKEDGGVAVGESARDLDLITSASTFSSVKRLMGRRVCELDSRMYALLPYYIMGDSDSSDFAAVNCPSRGCVLKPEQVSSEILRSLKSSAEEYLGEEVRDAVVSVPAYFGEQEREATREAAAGAGLHVLRMINEPAAAAVAYGIGKENEEFLLVFDLGGGTFDVSVLQIGDDVFEVLKSSGNNFLGGDDFDACVLDWMLEGTDEETLREISRSPLAMHELKEAAEAAKIALSTDDRAEVDVSLDGTVRIRKTITLEVFEDLTLRLIDEMDRTLREVLYGVETAEGDVVNEDDLEVVLVGGATQMKCIAKLIVERVGKEPKKGLVNPDEAVAVGAGLTAAALKGMIPREDIILLDESPSAEDLDLLGRKLEAIVDTFTDKGKKSSEKGWFSF